VSEFRCAVACAARGEPMAGTASVVRDWLLLEHPGPWGVDALRDGRDLSAIGGDLIRRSREADVRVLLIRRFGRAASGPVTAFAIHSGPDRPWVERIELARFRDAAGIELERVGGPEPPGLGAPHPDPLFLVCTHGRHDRCCAELGRPLAASMAEELPDATWESSHVGGDRFAGNLVAFPHGFYFGQVAPEDGPRVARAYLDGRLDLEHLRGRSCRAMAVQAAEHVLRAHHGLDGIDDVAFEDATRSADDVLARFATAAGRFEVRIVVEPGSPERLTCRSVRAEPPPVYREPSITRLGG
jgi:hypothetical protein